VPEGHAVHARSACGITEMSCALDGVGGDFRRVADETRERRGPQLPRARVPGAHAPNSCTDCDSHTRRITYNAEQTEANVKFTIIRLTVEVHTIVVIESSRLRAGSRCDLHPWYCTSNIVAPQPVHPLNDWIRSG
jgi:hypothetical protein